MLKVVVVVIALKLASIFFKEVVVEYMKKNDIETNFYSILRYQLSQFSVQHSPLPQIVYSASPQYYRL
jgi:hypothetical protein